MNRIQKSVLLFCLGGLFLSSSPLAHGQTELAIVIANDAGGSPEDYQNYADALAVTLKMLSSAQLEDVLQGGIPSLETSSDDSEGMAMAAAAKSAPSEGDEGVNLSPEYEAALDDILQAQSDVNDAFAALNAALLELENVLKNAGTLHGNSYGAISNARVNVADARKDLAAAREREIEAKAAFEEFD